MQSALQTIAITAVVVGLIASAPAAAEKRTAEVRSKRVQIVKRPVLESATHDTAIIRWTANTGGGTDRHYGIVRYGTDPKHLDKTARSPIKQRKNPPPQVTYRVRIAGLEPGTTYYYTVDAAQANGVSMRLASPVNKFEARPHP
jgi:phosphodiesterase/alkaline phosphatase D-like protein